MDFWLLDGLQRHTSGLISMLPDRPQRPLVGILGYFTALAAPNLIFSEQKRLYRHLDGFIGYGMESRDLWLDFSLPVWLEKPFVEILG